MLKLAPICVVLREVGQGVVVGNSRGIVLATIEVRGIENGGLEGRVGDVLGWVCGDAGRSGDGDHGGLSLDAAWE